MHGWWSVGVEVGLFVGCCVGIALPSALGLGGGWTALVAGLALVPVARIAGRLAWLPPEPPQGEPRRAQAVEGLL